MVVHYDYVLLVALSSLNSPVEGPCYQECSIYQSEFMVHVELWMRIYSAWHSLISQPLYIIAFIIHALIIRYHSDFSSSLLSIQYSLSQSIMSQVKHTYLQRFLRLAYVVD